MTREALSVLRTDEMAKELDIDAAIRVHLEWKAALRKAVAARVKLDARQVGDDSSCALGHWLHDKVERQFPQLDSYWDCAIAHSELHHEAERIAQLANQGRYDEAEAALGAGTAYSVASNKIIVALKMLRGEAKL